MEGTTTSRKVLWVDHRLPKSWNPRKVLALELTIAHNICSIATGACPWEQVLDYQPTPRRDFTKIEHCTDALASFLIQGGNAAEVKEYINKAVDWVLESCVWK